jgi:hypothetical protein
MLVGRTMLSNELGKILKTKLWHFLGIVPAVLWRDSGIPHNKLNKMADFQIEIGAWNLSMLNWFATILLWGLVYSWMINGVYFLTQP